MQNQFLPSENTLEATSPVTPSVMEQAAETANTRAATKASSALLAQAHRTVRARRRRFWTAVAIAGIAGFIPVLLSILFRHRASPLMTVPFYLVFAGVVLLAVTWILLLQFLPVKINAEALMRSDGVKAVPILLDAYFLQSTIRHRKNIVRALTLLLPQMHASDASLLTSKHHTLLNQWIATAYTPILLSGVDTDFLLALLKALEQVGNAKAVPIVAKLANTPTHTEEQHKIQQAAQDCLPLLQAHVSGMDTTQTLLRASMPQANTPDTLLRPASATMNTLEDELLRAANSQDSPPSV